MFKRLTQSGVGLLFCSKDSRTLSGEEKAAWCSGLRLLRDRKRRSQVKASEVPRRYDHPGKGIPKGESLGDFLFPVSFVGKRNRVGGLLCVWEEELHVVAAETGHEVKRKRSFFYK